MTKRALLPLLLHKHWRYTHQQHVGDKLTVNTHWIKHMPTTLQELVEWLKVYKSKSANFNQSSVSLGESTINLFTPNFLKPFLRKSIIYFLCEDIREAFGWSNKIPSYIFKSISMVFKIRGLLLWHFTLPLKTSFDFGLRNPKLKTSSIDHKTTFYQRSTWSYKPWYVKKTFWNRFWSVLGFSVPSSEFQQESYVCPLDRKSVV